MCKLFLTIPLELSQEFSCFIYYYGQAHFDCVPIHLRVVDGAKSRWCNLILIDAVIFLLELQEFNEGSRRSFNQQQVLLECIVAEIKTDSPEIYESYVEGNTQALSEVQVMVTGLGYPWGAVDTLKSVFLSDPTSKSRDKYVSIVEALFNHSVFLSNPFDLQIVFGLVVTHVLSAYPASKSCAFPAKRTPIMMKAPRVVAKPVMVQLVRLSPVVPPLSQRESARSLVAQLPDGQSGFDDSLFDDLLDAQLGDQPWDYLDEWDAADVPLQSRFIAVLGTPVAEPAVVANVERPSHPLPLDGAGCTMYGEPLVNVCHSSLSSFCPIDPHFAEPIVAARTFSDEPPVSPLSSSIYLSPVHPIPGGEQAASNKSNPVSAMDRTDVVPFPDFGSDGVYSRRTSFSLQAFAVLSLNADSPTDLKVRAVSLDVDEQRERTSSLDAIVWDRRSLGNDRESFIGGYTAVACCTTDSAAIPGSLNVVSITATPTQLEDVHAKPTGFWDSSGINFDMLDVDVDLGLDLDLSDAADLQSLFYPVEPAQLVPVCRPTPKRPSAVLDRCANDSSPSKRRALSSKT